eukprot:6367539-Pyramimonas_sp.AAC.1
MKGVGNHGRGVFVSTRRGATRTACYRSHVVAAARAMAAGARYGGKTRPSTFCIGPVGQAT